MPSNPIPAWRKIFASALPADAPSLRGSKGPLFHELLRRLRHELFRGQILGCKYQVRVRFGEQKIAADQVGEWSNSDIEEIISVRVGLTNTIWG
jgi:hypothetical protein